MCPDNVTALPIPVSGHDCQCSRFLTCAQLLMHAIAHGGMRECEWCMERERERGGGGGGGGGEMDYILRNKILTNTRISPNSFPGLTSIISPVSRHLYLSLSLLFERKLWGDEAGITSY